MTIIGGTIQIIVLLLPIILAAIAAKNTPQAIQETADEKIDKSIAAGDTESINILLHDRLQN